MRLILDATLCLLALAFHFNLAEAVKPTTQRHAKSVQQCTTDTDCLKLDQCRLRDLGNDCKCFKGSCEWVRPEKRPRWRRSVTEEAVPAQDDIGPDTCGRDRKTLSQWFLDHGMPSLLLEPIPPLVLPTQPDPYDNPDNPPLPPDQIPGFCALQWSEETTEAGLKKYTLKDFATEEDAVAAGYYVTHKGQCGSCSSLQDLGVYMGQNLTTPVRRCGMEGSISKKLMTDCLKRLGFSDNCIPIWEDNVDHTKDKCFWTCLKSWITNEPFNKPDGSLNDCLQCDEDNSGPNFKYFSGRTRRNSGIPSSIHRPASQIYNITHCYWYGEL